MACREEFTQNLIAEVGSLSSKSTHDSGKKPPAMSVSISTSLKPAYLPSPRDPSMFKEASSLARFGLDIGGTLCKVVYFEPLRESGIESDLQKLRSAMVEVEPLAEEGFVRGDVKKDNNMMENAIVVNSGSLIENGNSECSQERGQGSLPAIDSGFEFSQGTVEASCSKEFCPGKEKHVPVEMAKNGHAYEVELTKSIDDAETSKSEYRELSKKEIFRRQFNKIWVSNHEPVNLPGRGTIYFKCFETWRMEEFLSLTKELLHVSKDRAIGATGGGARKFSDRFLEIAGFHLQRADELRSLVRGIDFLARHADQESFEYPKGPYRGGAIQRPLPLTETSSDDGSSEHSGDEKTISENEIRCKAENECSPSANSQNGGTFPTNIKSHGSNLEQTDYLYQISTNEAFYPYLVVNIGSGVSILRVDSTDKFERVGGTSLGGSTFLGLVAALTGCNSFEEAMHLAREGDSTQIDMLVGDIYGGDYKEMNLASTTVASSFGKLVHPEKRSAAMKTPHHLAKAALLMVTNNIGSLAMLHARAADVKHVMFTGSFLHGNELAMRLLAVAMDFWSKGNMQAIFLRHEGHAGAVGALLNSLHISDPIDCLLFDESIPTHC
ncbi:hypothetical protein O6H91_04G021000 [Diphasiastrum complanatum]|uniref:Uncharacterized protein n=1 Tax=Diphasiastrum complanatum TaxID=34168 RepID=A0ACC2DV07_DIPCM|nr:hypothetical protein O6H91_04G021000 [Diphasiastrum complanatum]